MNSTREDLQAIAESTDAIVGAINGSGLQFAIVLEDRFATSVNEVAVNVNFVADTYFRHPAYAHDRHSGAPWLLLYGPLRYTQPSDWAFILRDLPPISLVTLDGRSTIVGGGSLVAATDTRITVGEFGWPYASNSSEESNRTDAIANTEEFYLHAATLSRAIGCIFPSFDDFYAEGGAAEGDSYFYVGDANGSTLSETVSLAARYAASVDMFQVATWK